VVTKSNLDVVKALIKAPGNDIDAGVYSYGWHGSHVRLSCLGSLIVGSIGTAECEHNLQADGFLIVPRVELVKLLANDPRTNLEDVFFEALEDVDGPKRLGALALLEGNVYKAPDHEIDYLSAMALMQAGSLMTKSWVSRLEGIDAIGETMKEKLVELKAEEKERADEEAQREPEAKEEEVEEEEANPRKAAAEAEMEAKAEPEWHKNEDGTITWQGLKFGDWGYFNSKALASRSSEVLQQRLDGLEDVKKWYGLVRCGSNVFSSPTSFPAFFCRVAATLDRSFKKTIGRRCVSMILDFLNFFEFNRARPLPVWPQRKNGFGRPLAPIIREVDAFLKPLEEQSLKERLEGVELPPEEAEEEKQDTNNSCWVLEQQAKEENPEDGEEGEEL